MVEAASDPLSSILENVLKAHKTSNAKIMQDVLASNAPDELVAKSEHKCAAIRDFKNEILGELQPILEKVEAIKQKISDKTTGKDEENGIISGELTVYLDCLAVDKKQIEELLILEEQHWMEQLEKA